MIGFFFFASEHVYYSEVSCLQRGTDLLLPFVCFSQGYIQNIGFELKVILTHASTEGPSPHVLLMVTIVITVLRAMDCFAAV